MKKEIHPKYYKQAEVICTCGNRFFVGSTKPILKIEVCSRCHPHFTGADKIVDKAGRIDKFQARILKHEQILQTLKTQRKKPSSKDESTRNRNT